MTQRRVADDPTGSLLRSSVPGPPEETGAIPPPSEDAPLPERLGPYRVLGRLGQGGMGIVYRGHDDTLDRPVALKVLARGRSSGDDELAPVEREARAIAAVTHPNVVQVYSAGEQDGLAFFAMELVPGPDLREVLEKEGPLAPDRARRYLAQAARGLGAAAKKGIFHRDVKPANLLVHAREDQVKVADFGLATRACVDASLGGTSLIAGTPLYVAPEVIEDGAGDARSDIYSLGACFYHLLAGVPPFSGSPAEALVGHAKHVPHPLRGHRAAVPEDLAAVIHRCLEKDPGKRFASYEDLIAAVERRAEAPPEAVAAPGPAPTAAPRPVPVPIRLAPAPARRGQGLGSVIVFVIAAVLAANFVRTVATAKRSGRPSRPTTRARTAPPPRDVEPYETEPSNEPETRELPACAFGDLARAVEDADVAGDLLCPKTVRSARQAGARLPSTGECRASGCRFAVCGRNSPVLAWHVHDARERTVHFVTRQGSSVEIDLLHFLGFVKRIASERGVSWPTVVANLRPFLPRDTGRRELAEISEDQRR